VASRAKDGAPANAPLWQYYQEEDQAIASNLTKSMVTGALGMMMLTTLGQGRTLYVAPNGDDMWSGAHPAMTTAGNNGPLASLAAARDAIRKTRAAAPDEAELCFSAKEHT